MIINQPLHASTGSVELKLKNTSNQRIYNASITVNLPIGVAFTDSLPVYLQPDAPIIRPTLVTAQKVTWENIADLLPSETVTVHAQFAFASEPTLYINDELILKAKGSAAFDPISSDQIIEEAEVSLIVLGAVVSTNTDDYKREAL